MIRLRSWCRTLQHNLASIRKCFYCSLILILVVLFVLGRRNLGKSGLRVSCLGLGEFLHCGWKNVSPRLSPVKQNQRLRLPSPSRHLGDVRIADLRWGESSAVDLRLPETSISVAFPWQGRWNANLTRSNGPILKVLDIIAAVFCFILLHQFTISLVRCWLFLLLSLFFFFFLGVRWRRTWWPWLMRTGWTSLTQQRFTLQEGAACFYMFFEVKSNALVAERSTALSFCNRGFPE